MAKKPEQLGPVLESYFIDRLQTAMKEKKPLIPAELNSIIKAHESGVMGQIFEQGEGAENSPSGELGPMAKIGFDSDYMTNGNGEIPGPAQPTNRRSNGTSG